MEIDRSELVRRLLGVATQLFVDDLDPISVHCLASSAAEHASFLSVQNKGTSFTDHILAVNDARYNLAEVRRLRNRTWNIIKHSRKLGGEPFDVAAELEGFSDRINDAVLFVVWYDFANSGQRLPVEAQAFQIWYFELYPETLNEDYVSENGRTNEFPNLRRARRCEQKEMLRNKIGILRGDADLLAHPKTDKRPLVLS